MPGTSGGLVLLNPLKVLVLSAFDKETALERLSNFLKVLQLEMTQPEMELYPPSRLQSWEFSALTLDNLPSLAATQEWRSGRGVLPKKAKSSSKEPFRFPT